MEFRYEETRIKRYVRKLVVLLAAGAGIFASISKEKIEPAFKNFLKEIDPTKATDYELFNDFLYLAVLGLLLYFLSDKVVIRIAEYVLSRRSELYGWWIYGFKIKDPAVLDDLEAHHINVNNFVDNEHEMYVIGKFKLLHTVTGMKIQNKGQSDYLAFSGSNTSARIEFRGTWIPYEIISNQNFSELWIIYHFERLLSDGLSYYDGLMKLSNTHRGSILNEKNLYIVFKEWLAKKTNKNILWSLLKPILAVLKQVNSQRYLYKGIIKDLNENGIKFSPMFAEKVPAEFNEVDEIDDLIIKNAHLIKKTIDELKTHKSI